MKLIQLILILLATISLAHAEPRLEAQIGQCNHSKAEKGVWWNDAYPTSMNLKSTCYQLGFSKITHNTQYGNFGYRLSYVDLGEMSADNQFAMLDEQQFTSFDRSQCNLHSAKNCVGRGQIWGYTKGVSLSGLAERSWTDFRFGAEAGIYAYYSVFNVAVSFVDKPEKGTIAYFKWSDWTATPFIGLSANYGYAFVSGRYYGSVVAHEHGKVAHSGLWDGPAYSLMIGAQVPLR